MSWITDTIIKKVLQDLNEPMGAESTHKFKFIKNDEYSGKYLSRHYICEKCGIGFYIVKWKLYEYVFDFADITNTCDEFIMEKVLE